MVVIRAMKFILPIIFGIALAACGGGGGGGGTTSSTTLAVSGSVVKGPVTGATVTFYSLNDDGSKGDQLGTTTTDTSGNFTVTLNPAPTKPFLAETSGGSYVNESTGNTDTLSSSDTMSAVLAVGTTTATVTPLTNIAAARALALAAGGTPLETAVDSSNSGVASQYAIADITGTLPPAANDANALVTTSQDQRIYALVLAGIAQDANSVGVRPIDLSNALAEDAKDGILDGKNGGTAVSVPLIAGGSLPLPTTAGTTDIQTAINAFIASANNKTNLNQISIPLSAVNMGVNTAGTLYTTSAVLPAAISGNTYTTTLAGTGGTLPYTCSLKSGSLPAGYSLVSSTCQITGTASAVSSESISAPFVITMTDSATPPNTVDFAPLYLTTTLAPPTISFPAQGTISEGSGGSFTVSVTGGEAPYYFKLDSFLNGTPPQGTSVDLTTGTVTIPSTAKAGVYSFGVCAVDLVGRESCATTTVTITYKGSLSGSYSGSGTSNGTDYTASGSFIITITDGVVSGSYSGNVSSSQGSFSDSGSITGKVDATGQLTAASGGTSAGSWSGTISKSGTSLTGSGSWTGSFSSGSWSGSGSSQ